MQGLLVEGKEINKDFSHEWVVGNADLTAIERGIPVSQFNQEMLKRDLEMEFRLIRRLTETQYHNDNLYDFHPDIQKLNRYNNIIPFKHSIVKLRVDDEEENQKESYINANFINLINGKEKLIIATQGPLTNTFGHFWRMNVQENVNLIVMLCNLKENQRAQCEQYWPKNVGETLVCGNVQVNMVSQDDLGNNIIKRTLKVTQEGSDDKCMTQLQWCGWPDQGVPSPSDFDVIRELLNMIIEKLLNEQKVVFHCSAGVGRTGTLIALSNLMILLRVYKQQNESINDNPELYRISIFGIVRRLREQRWGMVHTSEQYSYIYKFIDEAIRYLFAD